jgi:hypothetical protein
MGKAMRPIIRSNGFCGKNKSPVWSINIVMHAMSFNKLDFDFVRSFEYAEKKGIDLSFNTNFSTEYLLLP